MVNCSLTRVLRQLKEKEQYFQQIVLGQLDIEMQKK